MENNETPQKPTIEELHSGTSDIADAARDNLEKIDRDFSEKLESINSRVKTARTNAEKFKPEANNASGMNVSEAQGLGIGLIAAYSLIGTPIIFYGIGIAIDRATNRGSNDVQFAGLFGLLGFVVGLFITVMVSNRNTK